MTKHVPDFGMIWPDWVPDPVRRYLYHTGQGEGIRTLARRDSSHASTVSRQVRQVELDRDDSIIDDALIWLSDCMTSIDANGETNCPGLTGELSPAVQADFRAVTRDIPIVLRRLAHAGAVLALAEGMDRAVIVRDSDGDQVHRLGVVDRPVIYALALNGWIECDTPGRIRRFRITQPGRSHLSGVTAGQENRAGGFREQATGFEAAPASRRHVSGQGDTPVLSLARRRSSKGEPFLTADLVRAAERIQDDFELAQMEPRTTQNWDSYLTAGISGPGKGGDNLVQGASAARDRVTTALRALGPGLGDVVLECCCRLKGLEAAEKKLGWSARSGKIVLRIALQRLRSHYDGLEDGGGLIG